MATRQDRVVITEGTIAIMASQLARMSLARALLSAGVTLLFNSAAYAGAAQGTGITGSVHDFSGGTRQICVVCHTPHNAIPGEKPLWNHQLSTTDHTGALYSSGTLDATPGLPDGASKLCLSCHDGSVALDNFGGNTSGFTTLSGTKAIGLDGLSNDHPLSFVYEDARTNGDLGIRDSAELVTIGSAKTKSGPLSEVMLDGNGKLQCNSCHDVHNNYSVYSGEAAGNRLLKVTLLGSQLCLTCHTK